MTATDQSPSQLLHPCETGAVHMPGGRPAVPVWHCTVSRAQSRAAARCWPVRRDRDRRSPATPRQWRRRVAPRATLHIQPVASGVWRRPRAIAGVGWHGGSAEAGAAPAPHGCRPAADGSGLGARPRSAPARLVVCGLCAPMLIYLLKRRDECTPSGWIIGPPG